jgi:biopolymer transport protein ExbD
MAPMIDMVFLLLIFFMCASTLSSVDRSAQVELPVATHSEVPDDPGKRGTINIMADGTLKLAGATVSLEELRRTMQRRLRETPDLAITIRADRDLEHRHVKDVLRGCAEVGAYNVIFAAYQTAQGEAP